MELNQLIQNEDNHPFRYDLTFLCEAGLSLVRFKDDTNTQREFVVDGIHSLNSDFYSDSDVEIRGLTDELIGILCLKDMENDQGIDEMTPFRYMSYLFDCDSLFDISAYSSYKFKKSYVLIEKSKYDDYLENYKDGSAIWGGFIHDVGREVRKFEYPQVLSIKHKMSIPIELQRQKLQSAVQSSTVFDRFLKKYQLLELLYDYNCVLKLRMERSSLDTFQSIMSSYSKSELPALKSLVKDYVVSAMPYFNILENSESYKDTVKLIFQSHSKEGNPVKSEDNFNHFWYLIKEGGLAGDVVDVKLFAKTLHGKYKNIQTRDEFILELVCYWIYRIRCSIAHTKLGEYIFKPEDDEFLINVGEPLVDQVILDIYSNDELKKHIENSLVIDELIQEGEFS
jgi:hypothetical protein